MSKPKSKDADVILKLAELSALMHTQAGAEVIWQPDFSTDKYPPGTPEHTGILQLMRWMETIGTLYRNGLVNEDLLFDWLGITGTWDRLKPLALAIREHSSPSMWENFEHMAEQQRDWTPKRAQKAPAARPANARKPSSAQKVAAGKKGAGNGTS